MRPVRSAVAAAALMLLGARLPAQTRLTPVEQTLRDTILSERADAIAYLQHVVDIPSSTLNVGGVQRVGAVFLASLDSLGFKTTWIPMPPEMRRAGHLVAEHQGRAGNARLLLIGHFDTVVEPAGANFVREDSTARAVGGSDMKGGDVIILFALKALDEVGLLRDLNVTIVCTGDEEDPGAPLAVARAALIEAGQHSDVALAFEGGSRSIATVARHVSAAVQCDPVVRFGRGHRQNRRHLQAGDHPGLSDHGHGGRGLLQPLQPHGQPRRHEAQPRVLHHGARLEGEWLKP